MREPREIATENIRWDLITLCRELNQCTIQVRARVAESLAEEAEDAIDAYEERGEWSDLTYAREAIDRARTVLLHGAN